jgi:RNA polymerase primary sigma factor
MRQQTGRNARPEELAGALQMPTADVVRYLQIMTPMFSLDEPLGDTFEQAVGDMVPDYRQSESELSSEGLSDQMSKALDELKPRERQVIQLRFGLPDGRSKTLREVGQLLSVSPEGVRQIEARAVRKLRRPADRLSLQGFIRAR